MVAFADTSFQIRYATEQARGVRTKALREILTRHAPKPLSDALLEIAAYARVTTLAEFLESRAVEEAFRCGPSGGTSRLLDALAQAVSLAIVETQTSPQKGPSAAQKGAKSKPHEPARPVDPPLPPDADDPSLPPSERAALTEWASRHLIFNELTMSLAELLGRSKADVTAGFCVRDVFLPLFGQRLAPAQAQHLRELARKGLARRAAEIAARITAREAFVARVTPPDPEHLGPILEKLRERRARYGGPKEDAVHPDFLYPALPVSFEPGPPRLLVQIRKQYVLAVPLTAGGQVEIVGGWQAFDKGIALLAAEDALRDPTSEARAAWLAWLASPRWRDTLAALEERMRPRSPAKRTLRVAFRLHAGPGKIVIETLAQSATSSATTGGRKIQPARVPGEIDLDRLERTIVGEIITASRAPGDPWRQSSEGFDDPARGVAADRLFALLERLASHPRVYFGARGQRPARIERGRVAIALEKGEGGWEIRFRLGSMSLTPDQILRARVGPHHVLHADEERAAVVRAHVDARVIALATVLVEAPASFPHEAVDALLGPLQASQDEVDIDLPDELRGRFTDAEARPIVRLSPLPNGALKLSMRTRPLPNGALFEPGAPPARVFGASKDGVRIHTRRDLERERREAEEMLARLPLGEAHFEGPFDVRVSDADQAGEVLATLHEQGDAFLCEWPEQLRVIGTATRKSLQIRIGKSRDWFGVTGGAEIGGAVVPLAVLLAAARARRRFVRLSSGQLLVLARDLRERLAAADDLLFEGPKGVEAPLTAASALAGLVEDEGQLRADVACSAHLARLRAADVLDPEVPKALVAELRPYQREGFRWLARLAAISAGACLADDMGLGKTIQALALLVLRRELGPALVVAPTSVGPNWLDETTRFAPSLRTISYRGARRREELARLGPGDLVITSYDIVVRDADDLAPIPFSTIVFDEAHTLKNAASQRAQAARRLTGDFRLALTGTPVENHLGDLWSLFRVLIPGLLGSWERFRDRFAAPIEQDGDRDRREALARVVRPYMLRRTKGAVAPELPPRTDTVRYVDLLPPERALYEAERLRSIADLDRAEEGDKRFRILAAMLRLRQLACNARLVDPDATLPSSKLAAFLEVVDGLREGGHRALVFSQFTSHLALVRGALDDRAVRYLYLDGSTKVVDRAALVRRFQYGEAELFLISLKAGGTGLNLTAADYAVHLDPWWNPAAEDQASDRAHRIGQDRPVTVIRFIARDTIEQAVLALHADKREIADSLLAGSELAGKLSAAELVALMRGGGTQGSEEPEPCAFEDRSAPAPVD